jgi:hypothetical protein
LGFAHTIHTKDVVEIIYIGTTPAEISKIWHNTVKTGAITTRADIITIIIITTTIITIALTTLTNFAREIIFTGTIRAEASKIYITVAAAAKLANTASASPIVL